MPISNARQARLLRQARATLAAVTAAEKRVLEAEKRAAEKEKEASEKDAPSLRDLLAAVNAASAGARNAWLAFLGLMAYLVVTLAGITHRDLLLNAPTTLPFVNVKIPLTGFFASAPIVLLFFHFGLLVQHAMLFAKIEAFIKKLNGEKPDHLWPDHPVQDEVHSYFFTQSFAGREPGAVMACGFHAMMTMSFILAPVFILFYFQIKFLAFHDELTTWLHRIYLLVDIVFLIVIGFFLGHFSARRRSQAPGARRWRVRALDWTARAAAWIGITRTIALLTFLLSLFVATVPDGRMEKFVIAQTGWTEPAPVQCNVAAHARRSGRPVFAPTAWLYERKVLDAAKETAAQEHAKKLAAKTISKSDHNYRPPDTQFTPLHCQVAIWLGGSRNLDVADIDFVKDKDITKGETTINLRERNLQYAEFSRSDLKQADFHGAKLQGAKFAQSDLKSAKFRTAQAQGADLGWASLQGANLRWASLQGADLGRASLQGADLGEAGLQGADLGEAGLQGADLGEAGLQGADLGWASLQGADLGWASLQGANLRWASLQGADLGGARLQGADLGGARLQGADLGWARLQGADLGWARLQGADLRRAGIWLTPPSRYLPKPLTQFGEILVRPLTAAERTAFDRDNASLKRLAQAMAKEKTPGYGRVAAALGKVENTAKKISKAEETGEWQAIHNQWRQWADPQNRPPPKAEQLACYLAAELACTDDTDKAYVAQWLIATRIAPDDSDSWTAPAIFYNRFKNCPAAKKVPAEIMARLKKAAEDDAAERAKKRQEETKEEETKNVASRNETITERETKTQVKTDGGVETKKQTIAETTKRLANAKPQQCSWQ